MTPGSVHITRAACCCCCAPIVPVGVHRTSDPRVQLTGSARKQTRYASCSTAMTRSVTPHHADGGRERARER